MNQIQKNSFCNVLSQLRRMRGYSQRKVASDLQISQALLSHYENGAREPGLDFVCRACDYFEVTADCLLGRTPIGEDESVGALAEARLQELAEKLRELADFAES